MMDTKAIRYLALDFDNVICELNPAFKILWDIFTTIQADETLRRQDLREKWIQQLEEATGDCKIHTLNTDVLMILKHVAHMPEQKRPTVFVYTNNSSVELVEFVRDWVALALKRTAWTLAFHPQDPRRAMEFPELAPDEPGKRFEGMKACLGNPQDFTPESVVFLDDLLHPARHTLGANYIHIQPPYFSNDILLPYLRTFVKAYQKTNPQPAIEKYFRMIVRNKLAAHKQNIQYFPGFQDSYERWDTESWDEYFGLFIPFGSFTEPSTSSSQSLKYYELLAPRLPT